MTDDDSLHGRDKRSSVIIRASVIVAGMRLERRVRNLSLHGACIDNQNDLTVGATVYVSMGALDDLAAEVMWASPRLAGLRFTLPIDLEAARRPRGTGTVASAGWMRDVDSAYRIRGNRNG